MERFYSLNFRKRICTKCTLIIFRVKKAHAYHVHFGKLLKITLNIARLWRACLWCARLWQARLWCARLWRALFFRISIWRLHLLFSFVYFAFLFTFAIADLPIPWQQWKEIQRIEEKAFKLKSDLILYLKHILPPIMKPYVAHAKLHL